MLYWMAFIYIYIYVICGFAGLTVLFVRVSQCNSYDDMMEHDHAYYCYIYLLHPCRIAICFYTCYRSELGAERSLEIPSLTEVSLSRDLTPFGDSFRYSGRGDVAGQEARVIMKIRCCLFI